MFKNRARALPSRTLNAHPISAAGAVTYRTETQKRTCEPTWNADFELPIFAMATVLYLCSVCGVPCRFATRIFIHVHVHLRHVASACKCPSTAHMHIDMSSICRWASSKRWCTAALKGVFVRGVQSLTVAIFDQDSITKGKKLVGCTFADMERTKHVCVT